MMIQIGIERVGGKATIEIGKETETETGGEKGSAVGVRTTEEMLTKAEMMMTMMRTAEFRTIAQTVRRLRFM